MPPTHIAELELAFEEGCRALDEGICQVRDDEETAALARGKAEALELFARRLRIEESSPL